MHNDLRRLWKLVSGGITGNGISYTEFLLEHILEQVMVANHPSSAVLDAVKRAADAAEADRAEREKSVR